MLFVPEVPPPTGQFLDIQSSAADDAANCVLNPEPLLLRLPLRQLAIQFQVVTGRTLKTPRLSGSASSRALALLEGLAHWSSATVARSLIRARVVSGPTVNRLPLVQKMSAYHCVVLSVSEVPPPAGQFVLIHARAAVDAADREAYPERPPLPVPMRQLAVQP